jgi:hypothetical protein
MKNENKRYYVYLHINEETNEVFYVGKGTGTRALSTKSRNVNWYYYTKKNYYRVEFVKMNLTNNEAMDLEYHTIMKYGIVNLLNIANRNLIRKYRQYGNKLFCFITDDPKSKITKNQKLAQVSKIVGERRTKEVIDKIINCLENWNFEVEGKVTAKKISKLSNVGLSTIEKYYSIFKNNIQEINKTKNPMTDFCINDIILKIESLKIKN